MIYDCFLFNNELEILDIRLHTLNDVVDKFVLAEATVTHTNKKKPLYFQKNKHKFKKFKDKIIHIVIDDSPDVSNAWIIERFQLSEVVRGLKNCKPTDTILFSCVDEIPKPEKILEWKDKPGRNKVFLHKMSWYFFNCVEIGDWEGTHMYSYKNLKSYESTYHSRFSKVDIKIKDGGWHFTYMGGIKRIQEKLASYIHQEFNNDKYNTPEKIMKAIANREDFLDHGLQFKIINDLSFLPPYVIENKGKFNSWFAKRPKDDDTLSKIRLAFLEQRLQLRLLYRSFRRKIQKIIFRSI